MPQVSEAAGDHLLVRDRVNGTLYQVDLTTGNIHAKFRVKKSVVALATNPANTLIYWSDIDGNRILSSNFSGSDVTTVFDIETERALSAAVDPVSGNIYYTAQRDNNLVGSGYIAVLSPDGRMRKILVSEGQHVPKSIHLHSAKGLMFWAETQFKKMIWRANMDGSNHSSIISAEVKGSTGVTINTGAPPIGVAVDTEADRLYWFDGSRDIIQKCSLTGKSCEDIVTDPGAGITSLVVVGDKLYYTASNRGGITEVHKADGKGQRFLGKVQDLLVVARDKTLSVQNECSENNGDCSAFCLPTSTGKTCTCADGRTCEAQGVSSKLSHKEAVLLTSFSLVAAIALLGVF